MERTWMERTSVCSPKLCLTHSAARFFAHATTFRAAKTWIQLKQPKRQITAASAGHEAV